MNIVKLIITSIAITSLFGCTNIKAPQTPTEFRALYPNKHLTMESYDVAVPLDTVASNFSRLAPQCLDKTVVTTSSNAYGVVSRHYDVYKSTVVENPAKAELHVQFIQQGAEGYIDMPKDGVYLIVVDATKVNAGTTHIDLLYGNFFTKSIVPAIKGWTKNERLGCPDLTN